MLEMLGVLAVIGILSIASLSGMTYLKEKNIANQITKEAITQAAEIKARAKQFVDGSGEIQYARGGESLYISSRRYGATAVGKTTLILSAKMRDENGNFNQISKSLCQKMISKKKVGIFDCILADESATTCPTSEDADVSCKEDNVIVFITDATTTTGGNSKIDACANVRCPDDRVCAAGVCVCKPPKYEGPNGTCISCGEPKAFCHLSDEQLSAVDTNGCPIYERKNCPENACNLLTGDCCDLGETYDATAQLCCLPAKRLTACDSEVSSSLGECSYYQGCIDSTCYTEYDNDGECCADMNSSENCCYAVHIRENPIYYTTANVKNLLKFDNFTSDQKCTCKHNFAEVEKVCCKEGEIVSEGHCCPEGQEYQASIGACCPTGQYASISQECCSAGSIVSEGHCCPVGQEWVEQTKACEVPCIGIGLTGDRDETGACICDLGIGNACACPAGQTLVAAEDGTSKCRRMHCTGGPTYYDCNIDGLRCGYRCDSTGKGCNVGICYADACPANRPFSKLAKAQYYYKCKAYEDSNMICYGSSTSLECHSKDGNGMCMGVLFSNNQLDMSSAIGTCNKNICSQFLSSDPSVYYDRWGDVNTNYGGCHFSGNLMCFPTGNTWKCFKNGFVCGTECSTPLKCGTCNGNYCPSGLTANGNRCDGDDFYCKESTNDHYLYCYKKSDNSRCTLVPFHNYKSPVYGSFSDPGCPVGTTYGRVSGSGYWGCVGNTGSIYEGMACSFNTWYQTAECYYEKKLCGRGCNYAAQGCTHVYLPQCANAGECPQTGYNMTGNDCSCTGQITTVGEKDFCCPKGHIYLGGMCSLSACADDKYVTTGGICVTAEECNGYSMFLSGKMCVEKCPKTQVASEGVCVDACPDAQVVSEGICVDACPAGQFVFDRVCIKSCSASQVLSKGSCVTKCPTGQVVANICDPNNSTSCQNVCVDTCPEGQKANAQNICQ